MSVREIQVKTANLNYRILIGENALDEAGKSIRLLFPSTRALLVSDSNVYSLYGEKVLQSLTEQNFEGTKSLIRPGESSKVLEVASRLYDFAVEAGLDRNSPIIVLGGGVVGDLAGFVAATYLRGVPLIMLPTTLLAQVDSSVGGKVAINHPQGKNLIGAIYPPRLVIIDPLVLNTLPEQQFKAGLAEVVKYSIIADSSFFWWLEDNLKGLMKHQSAELTWAITASVKAKAKVVEEDEFEKDYRRVLNFGHTIGHALEAATDYTYYLHGEAVLIGMALAVKLAERINLLESHTAWRINNLLARLDLKKPPPDLTAEMVADKLRQDKKRRDGSIIFVLPRAIGSANMIPVNDEKLISELINLYLQQKIFIKS